MIRFLLALLVGSIGAYLIVKAIRFLAEDTDYFPTSPYEKKKED